MLDPAMSPTSPDSHSPVRPPAPAPRFSPASPVQERLWHLDQRHPGRPLNNLPIALSLDGPLDAGLLAAALNDVVARHDIFRTHFDVADGRTVQVVAPALNVPVPVIDLRLLPAGAREAQAFRLAREEAARAFDPHRLPLIRTQLYLFEDTKRILVLTLHRGIFDHDSLGILLRELAACYEARRHASAPCLPPLPLQYADYAARQWESGPAQQADLDWWRTRLADTPTPLRLPSDRGAAASTGAHGRIEKLELAPSLRAAVDALARRTGTNSFTICFAAFQVLLHRYTNRNDFTVGMAVSDRAAPETENLLGQFSKVIPFRASLGGDPAFRALLDRVRTEVLETFAHSGTSFEVALPRLTGDATLACPIQFSHQRSLFDSLGWPGVSLSELELESGSCPCELSFQVVEDSSGLGIRAEYDADLFSPAVIQRLLAHFSVLLQAAASRPQSRLSELPLLTAPERRRLFIEWNNTFADFPRDATVHELISAQAAATPAAAAIAADGAGPTYAELDARSNQVGRHLRAAGIRPGTLVGVCLARTPALVSTLVGIWKAGGAVMLLDAAASADPIARQVKEAAPDFLFAENATRALLPVFPERILVLEAEAADIRRADESTLAPLAGPDDVAAVAWTAGTGEAPRPVQLTHRVLVGSAHAFRRLARPEAADVLLATAPLGSIEAFSELLLPLLFGARLALPKPDEIGHASKLIARIQASGATLMMGPPSLWESLLAADWTGCRTLRLFSTGETLAGPLAERLASRCHELWNVYGTAETAGACLAAPIGSGRPAGVVGRPMANVQAHLLDRHLQAVPVGITGEICVGGDLLANGYHRQATLTTSRFIPDPFRRIPGARLFRTGDLGRRNANGEIEFLGRMDHVETARETPRLPAGIAAPGFVNAKAPASTAPTAAETPATAKPDSASPIALTPSFAAPL